MSRPSRRQWLRWFLLGLAVSIAAGVLAGLLLVPATSSPGTRAAPLAGHPPPPFALPTLGGAGVPMSRYRGHPLLLQFWAVNCASCAAERVDLLRASRAFQARGGLVLGVDSYLEPPSMVRSYLRTHPEPYNQIWLDPDGAVVFGKYRIAGVPTSLFITRGGTIQSIVVGQMSRAAFERAFARLLATPGAH